MWATLSLTIVLYVTMSTQLFKIDFTSSKNEVNFAVVVFYFLPTVFMVLCFALMYYQMELLMTVSRITGGEEMRSRLKNKKLAVIMRILVYTVMGVFVVIQLIMMALALFGAVNVQLFVKQCWIYTLIIILFLNVYQIFVYFKLAGRPYKNEKFVKSVKHVGLVVVLWNLGFIIKFAAITAGKSIFSLDKEQEIDTLSACLFGAFDFFSLVIPFYSVVNTKFVKIFSFKAFERKQDLVLLEENLVDSELLTRPTGAYDNSSIIVSRENSVVGAGST